MDLASRPAGHESNDFPLASLLGLIGWAFTLSGAAKRNHDLGRNGWFTVVLLLPIVGTFFSFELLLKRGSNGWNKFGADPVTIASV